MTTRFLVQVTALMLLMAAGASAQVVTIDDFTSGDDPASVADFTADDAPEVVTDTGATGSIFGERTYFGSLGTGAAGGSVASAQLGDVGGEASVLLINIHGTDTLAGTSSFSAVGWQATSAFDLASQVGSEFEVQVLLRDIEAPLTGSAYLSFIIDGAWGSAEVQLDLLTLSAPQVVTFSSTDFLTSEPGADFSAVTFLGFALFSTGDGGSSYSSVAFDEVQIIAVPESSSGALLVATLFGVTLLRRRRRCAIRQA